MFIRNSSRSKLAVWATTATASPVPKVEPIATPDVVPISMILGHSIEHVHHILVD